jgi:hypothetical protein
MWYITFKMAGDAKGFPTRQIPARRVGENFWQETKERKWP